MPGFSRDADELRASNIGYRSEQLYGDIAVTSYNGFVFPPALNNKVQVQVEYDETNRTVKYLTCTLEVSFILTDPSNSILSTNDDLEHIAADMDVTIQSVLKRLTSPCQKLIFKAQGFGEFEVNGQAPNTVKDVDFGPKPQVVEWEPLGGGQAARVTWICVTKIPHCTRTPTGELLQFGYEYSVDWDTSGFIIRNITGFAEWPLTRDAYDGDIHAKSTTVGAADRHKRITEILLKLWPHHKDFQRTVHLEWSNNFKECKFTINEVELHTRSMFPPGVSNIRLSQNVVSSLGENGGNFLRWRLTYTGSIEATKAVKTESVHDAKKLAWFWLGKILQKKRQDFMTSILNAANRGSSILKDLGVSVNKDGDQPIISGSEEYQALESIIPELQTLIYPIYVSITDNMYGNEIDFTVAYMITCTTDLLQRSLGLFDPVKADGLKRDSWVQYKIAVKGDGLNDIFETGPNVIVDLCHPLSSNEPSPGEQADPPEKKRKSEPITAVSEIDKSKGTWESYENKVSIHEIPSTVIGSKLQPESGNTVEQLFLNGQDLTNKPVQTGATGDEQYVREDKKLSTYSPTPSKVLVRMRGYASRFGGPINAPVLLGVGSNIGYDPNTGKAFLNYTGGDTPVGALAHKYGEHQVHRKAEVTGLTSNGVQVVRHICAWDKWYILDSIPNNGLVYTNGIPTRFQTTFKAVT